MDNALRPGSGQRGGERETTKQQECDAPRLLRSGTLKPAWTPGTRTVAGNHFAVSLHCILRNALKFEPALHISGKYSRESAHNSAV
jgi:hypothetical protein